MYELSLNEVQTTVVKACLGAGVDPGCSAEVGVAARWLCAHGFDGVAAAAAVLCADVALVGAGLSAVDLVLADGVADVDSVAPLILVGHVGVACAMTGGLIKMSAQQWSCDIDVTGARLTGAMTPGVISLHRAASASDGSRAAEQTGPPGSPAAVMASNPQWATLCELAARTYVASSAHSRVAGAGAGLSDND